MGNPSDLSAIRKSTVVLALSILAIAAALILRPIGQVLLLAFGAVLFAILLEGVSSLVGHFIRTRYRIALSAVVALASGLLILTGFLIGPGIARQLQDMAHSLLQALGSLRQWIQELPFGTDIVSQADESIIPFLQETGLVGGVLSSATGFAGAIGFVLIVGLFIAYSPAVYLDNGLRLVPPARRERARTIVGEIGQTLRWWLVGRFASMVVVGVLTLVSYLIIGLPLALTLAILTALLSFVPYLGTALGVVPALLVGMTVSPTMVVYVIAAYTIVQALEGNLTTPLIEQKFTSVPAGLLLTIQVIMGVLAGLLGVFLATPIAVVIIILIQEVYVEDRLGESVVPLGIR